MLYEIDLNICYNTDFEVFVDIEDENLWDPLDPLSDQDALEVLAFRDWTKTLTHIGYVSNPVICEDTFHQYFDPATQENWTWDFYDGWTIMTPTCSETPYAMNITCAEPPVHTCEAPSIPITEDIPF